MWLFARAPPLVFYQMTRLGKRRTAHFTRIRLLAGVRPCLQCQLASRHKHHVADIAGIRLRARACPEMNSQVCFRLPNIPAVAPQAGAFHSGVRPVDALVQKRQRVECRHCASTTEARELTSV